MMFTAYSALRLIEAAVRTVDVRKKNQSRYRRAERSPRQVEALERRVLLAATYGITDLGVLSNPSDASDSSHAFNINNQGQVVGQASIKSSYLTVQRAFLWTRDTAMQNLGTLPDLGWSSVCNGINDSGQMVGGSGNGVDLGDRAALWAGGAATQLPSLVDGAWSGANAINNLGEAVGFSDILNRSPGNDPVVHAVLWNSDHQVQDLGLLPGDSHGNARSINDNGQVVGTSAFGGVSGHAFLWTQGAGMQSLGDLQGGAGSSEGISINAVGEVVGDASIGATGSHAFLWIAGQGMQDLGVLSGAVSSTAYDINNTGQVVGTSTFSSGSAAASIWTSDGGMQNLNTLMDSSGAGWVLLDARAINDSGQIVGSGFNPNGQSRAFLLTPVAAPTAPANVQASDGSFADHVHVSWNAVTDATSYEVWRSTTNASSTARLLTQGLASTSYDDTSAASGTTYYYWVKASNAAGTSGFGLSDAGYRQVSDTIPPTADLADPINGGTIQRSVLNSRRYIDVTFADAGGSGLNPLTITDTARELTLSGPAANNVVVNGAPTLVSGTTSTYRYTFISGQFGLGTVQVSFLPGTWADNAGNVNAATTESFTVTVINPAVTTLQNNVPVTGLWGAFGNERLFKLTVPSGASGLKFQLSGGIGNADLYVKYGSQPTTSSYDYRPYLNGNNETVVPAAASPGDWYVMVRGRPTYAGVSLVASYNSTIAQHFRYPLDDGHTAPDITGPFGGDFTNPTTGAVARGHLGEDLRANYAPVFAVANGRVTQVIRFGDPDYSRTWGQIIIIEHTVPGLATPVYSLYAHLSAVSVQEGQWVAIGDRIGTSGIGDQDARGRPTRYSYAPHLHFEIRAGAGAGTVAGSGYAGRELTSAELASGVVTIAGRTYYRPSSFISARLLP